MPQVELDHDLKRVMQGLHNLFAHLSDDDRYSKVVEFFRSLAKDAWEEEMAEALERLGYIVSRND